MNPDRSIATYRDLEVWQLSMDLVDLVYISTEEMRSTDYDLVRQVRRAAVSIPANIAEGYRRKKKRGAYQNHISIALGSQGELETELEICARNALLSREACANLCAITDRVGAMLNRLHDALN